MTSPAYQSFEDIFEESSEPDMFPIREDEEVMEETFPTTRVEEEPRITKPSAQKPKREPPGIEEMMGKFMKMMGMDSFSKVMAQEETPVKEDEVQLENMGLVLKMLFVLFLRFLGWFIRRSERWLPMHFLFSEFHQKTTREVKAGWWDDLFDGPDQWVFERVPSYAYDVMNAFFFYVLWVMRHNRVTIPIFTFLLGLFMS
jgi:hypothetical protein